MILKVLLHLTIKLTVTITSNTKRRPNVISCVADNDTALNHQRVRSMCLLGTLNVLPFEKKTNICLFKSTLAQCASASNVQILAQICVSVQVHKCASTCASVQLYVQVRTCASTQLHKYFLKCVSAQVRLHKYLHKCVSAQVLARVC